jgi:23S rRNA pseudouridine1911/1915/1917 synthase
MPSKNMLPKGQRRRTVKHEYRAQRDLEPMPETIIPALDEDEIEAEGETRSFTADAAAAGKRLDAYLAKALPDISRARIQLLIDNAQVRVDAATVKASHKLKGGERIEVEGEPRPAPLRAVAEDIPLTVVYEDGDIAVIDKPAGMMVHAGAGATESEQNSGTLVNALLHHFSTQLSAVGGELRPGIVHRLDKQTSGLILVAKNDKAHRALSTMFSERALDKHYIALVHGELEKDRGTIDLPIARDLQRRTRMTTRRFDDDARSAISHYTVLERLHTYAGDFTLVDVHIETGRTHQIRVHMQSLGHPVVGDTLYGAPGRFQILSPATSGRRVAVAPMTPPQLNEEDWTQVEGDDEGSLAARVRKPAQRAAAQKPQETQFLSLDRNFLHAARLSLAHPITGAELELEAVLPAELEGFLKQIRGLSRDS